MSIVKIEIEDKDSINEKVVDKLKSIIDEVESKIDCVGGHSLRIGNVYIDNCLCDLFMQFGYSSYFYALDTSPSYKSKSVMLDSKYTVGLKLEEMKFRIFESNILYDKIEKKIKEIVTDYNEDISNKENFCKLIK